MHDSPFVHDSSSSDRVPNMIQIAARVPVEFRNEFPFFTLGILFRTPHLLLVITKTKNERTINETR
jgi:hypothetical protein